MLSPASFTGTLRAEVDDLRVAAGRLDDVAHPVVEVVAVEEHDVGVGRLAARPTGAARSRAGSVFGLRTCTTLARSPPTARAKSPIWVVVATTLTWPGAALPPPVPHPPASSASAPTATAAAAGRRAASTRAAATTAKTPPASTAIAGPGGALACTDSHSPATPSTATSATVASCHGPQARAHEPRGGRRDDEQRRGQQRAERRERGDGHERHEREQRDVGRRRASAEGSARSAGSKPVASQRCSSTSPATSTITALTAAKA